MAPDICCPFAHQAVQRREKWVACSLGQQEMEFQVEPEGIRGAEPVAGLVDDVLKYQ